jgi:hypothetical protein
VPLAIRKPVLIFAVRITLNDQIKPIVRDAPQPA